MSDKVQKLKKALFHGFPDDDNVEVKNILSSIERTYLPIGSQIGRYKIIEEIDRGGMAVVYKANQEDLEREVALKVLPANVTINENFVQRFLTEAHSVAKLRHPNIVSIHEVDVQENIYYLSMEYIPGKNLFYFLNQEKPKLVVVLEIVRKLADALQYAHEQMILHRDLKLNNVIMRDNKEPVLIDFGLAKVIGGKSDNLTKTGEILGSPAYMAPERIFGKGLDARSDVCSLGIMLYEMLTFKNPYLDPRSMIQTTRNVVEANPVPPRKLIPWLPVEVESITLMAMRGEVEERYASMKEFSEDIQRYQRGEPIKAKPLSRWAKTKRFLKRHQSFIINILIILIFSALIATIIVVQGEKRKSRWQIVFVEQFCDEAALQKWFEYAEGGGGPKNSRWRIVDSALCAQSGGYSYFRLESIFTADVKVEFDLRSVSGGLFNTGFFICGSRPENGYCFYIHRGNQAINAVSYPGSEILFYDYKPLEFMADSQYHVTIEKKEGFITFLLGETVIARINDFFPAALGKENQKMGFFVNGGTVAFDNLKVYRMGVPRFARPTLIAERFWEQGDFETALNEYREVLIDLSRSDITIQIRFRMVDCLIRLGDYTGAEAILMQIEKEKNISEPDRARILFFRGMISERGENRGEKNAFLNTLAEVFQESPYTKSAAAYMAMDCDKMVASGQLDSAESRIIFMARKYPAYASYFGRIHLKILDYYIHGGLWKNALSASRAIEEQHQKDEEVFFSSRILIARGFLGRRDKSKAVDALNKCLASIQPAAAVWTAWMLLAEVYESDYEYKDAYSIYKKVFDGCPRNLPVCWIARIKMAELEEAAVSSPRDPMEMVDFVVKEPHVFAEPRLIARFYRDMIDADEFVRQWRLMHAADPLYLYYLSSKAMMAGDAKQAVACLKALKQSASPFSWEYVRAAKLIDAIISTGGLKQGAQSRKSTGE